MNSEPTIDSNPPLGCFESYCEHDGQLVVSGWLLWLDGPADTIAFHKGGGDHLIARNVDRPDLAVAFPHIPRAEQGGFAITLPLALMRSGPIHECIVTGLRQDRELGSKPLRYHTPGKDVPFPPPSLMERIALSTDEVYFLATGIHGANDLLACTEVEKVRTVLDWGCGCGRLTRHVMDRLPHAELHGVDIDEECITWLRDNQPRGSFHLCRADEPLSFDEGFFDLILATSMFTQISIAQQEKWIPELARVLAPDGTLLATTHGHDAARFFHQPLILDALVQEGVFDGVGSEYVAENDPKGYLRAAFQTEAYTRRRWGEHVEIAEYIPCGLHFLQDLWILKKG